MSTQMEIGFVDELGVIEVKSRPARVGRNPAAGEATQIKASKKIALRRISSTPYKSPGCRASSARHPQH
jgi:nucleoid DNA-binding protein